MSSKRGGVFPGHPDLFTTTANFNIWINSGAFMAASFDQEVDF